MKLTERMEAIEDAHRALAARNEALFQICKATLPIALISNKKMVRRLLTSCYDATNEHMDRHEWDSHMQEMVRAALDELSNVLILVDTPPRHPS